MAWVNRTHCEHSMMFMLQRLKLTKVISQIFLTGVSLKELSECLQLSVPTDMSKTHLGKTRGNCLTGALFFLASLPCRASQVFTGTQYCFDMCQDSWCMGTEILTLLWTSPDFHFFTKCWLENEVVYIMSDWSLVRACCVFHF